MTATLSNDPDVLLIDINGLGYAAMYQPNLARLSFNGQSTAALHGAVTSVLSRMNEFPNAVPELESLVTPETREIYGRNLTLMDWKLAPELDSSTLSAFWLQPDLGLLEDIAIEYGLTKVVAAAKKVGSRRDSWGPAWFDVCKTLGV